MTTETSPVIVRFGFYVALFLELMTGNTLLILVLLVRKLDRKLRHNVALWPAVIR